MEAAAETNIGRARHHQDFIQIEMRYSIRVDAIRPCKLK
jgi:hypothetical protein